MASEEIKRKIIENTKILLQQNASITIKDIAEASYVNIAAVNYHFGSKENLMRIVVEEIIREVKGYIVEEMITMDNKKSFEIKLNDMTHYLYKFALENIGLFNYLFLSNELQKESSSMLINEFFTDNEFTRMIYESIKQSTSLSNPKEIYAQYIVLFSSFCIPLFIQIAQFKLDSTMRIEMFTDPEFSSYFIKRIMKMVEF